MKAMVVRTARESIAAKSGSFPGPDAERFGFGFTPAARIPDHEVAGAADEIGEGGSTLRA